MNIAKIIQDCLRHSLDQSEHHSDLEEPQFHSLFWYINSSSLPNT